MAAPYLLDLQRRVITLAGIPGNLDDLGDVTVPAPDDCDVLTYDAGTSEWINAPLGEGPGIDIVCLQIGLGGDTVLLYDSTGNPVAEYAASDAGLTAGLAAMGAGDTLFVPSVTITGGPWTVSAGTLRGTSLESTLEGPVIVQNGCVLYGLSVVVSDDDAGAIYGVKLEPGGKIVSCQVEVTNATGDARAVYGYSGTGGDCHSHDCRVEATAGGDAYAFYANGVDLYVQGGYIEPDAIPTGAE